MIANIVPSDEVVVLLRDALLGVGAYTDVAPTVSLLVGEYDVHDGDSWPAASAAFTPLVATDPWELQFDALSGKTLMVAPDPDGGWDFVSTGAGVEITGFKVTGTATTDHVFAARFLNPIPVTEVGQHITIPYIAADASIVLLDGQNPYDME